MSFPGCFITLEGGEGAGKTTHISTITQFLAGQGIDFITTREPGGTPVSESIRGILLNAELPAMHFDTELLLMFAARNEHLQQVIIPALQQGQWVICDRFTDASYAYQGHGRGLSLSRIAALETWVQRNLRPDFTFLFDLDVNISLQRVQKRSAGNATQIDRFEREQVDFHQKIRDGYLARCAEYPRQFIKIQADNKLEVVEQQVLKALKQVVENRVVA